MVDVSCGALHVVVQGHGQRSKDVKAVRTRACASCAKSRFPQDTRISEGLLRWRGVNAPSGWLPKIDLLFPPDVS